MFDKIKQLSKETAVYGLSTIIGRFLNFLLVPIYTNVFSTGDFGIYSNIYAYVAFLNIVFIYGMDAAFMKYASLDENDSKTIFSNGFLIVTISSIVLCSVMLIFNESFAKIMLIPEQYMSFIYYVILILLFDTIALIPFANLRLQKKSVKFASIKISNILLNLGLNLILIFEFNWGIEAIFLSNLMASLLSLILLTPDIAKYLRFKIEWASLKIMLKFGVPYLPASIAAMMVQVIDRPVVLLLTDESTLGIYQANYKLGIFMMLIVMMFQYAWQPFFLTNAKEKNAKEIFGKVLTIFLIVASSVWVVLSLFIKDIASFEFWNGRTLIGKDFLSGIDIVPIILLAYIFHGLYVNFTAGIYIEEKTKYFPFITGGGALINVLSNLIFIPKFGLMGAAYATLASYVFMSGGLFFVSQKFYKIKYEYSKVFRIFLLMFFVGILNFNLIKYGYDSLLSKLALMLLFGFSLVALRIIKLDEIRKIKKNIL